MDDEAINKDTTLSCLTYRPRSVVKQECLLSSVLVINKRLVYWVPLLLLLFWVSHRYSSHIFQVPN